MEETLEIVPIKFQKMVLSSSYSCIVLGTEEKSFAIYIDPANGQTIQKHLTNTEKPRPYTHDLINNIFQGLEIKVKHVVINEAQDALYLSRIFLEQHHQEITNIIEIDARPSDCITLALLHKVPIYCAKNVLESAIPYQE